MTLKRLLKRNTMKVLVQLLFFVSIPAFCLGQVGDQHQRIMQEKVKFFNKKLDLTKTEAENFWPIYNDYQNRRNRIASDKRTLMKYYNQNSQNMTSQEITATLNKYMAYEKQETDLLLTYNEKFRSVLPDDKVLRIYIAEVQFKDYLLTLLRTR